MHRRERHVDGVELIVAGGGRHHPARRRHDADDAKRLLPDRDRASDRMVRAEQPFRRDRAEHDDLLGARLLARGEESSVAERPRAADLRQLKVGAVEAREPALLARDDVHFLVQPFGDVLDAANAADGLGVGGRERRCRSEARLAVAEPLPRGRVIVLLHRIVFRMERDQAKRGRRKRGTTPFRVPRRRLDRAAAVVVGRLHLVVARGDDDQVHPGRADLIRDRRLRARADRDHGEHRRDADRHADNRQRRLQPVAPQGTDGDGEARS